MTGCPLTAAVQVPVSVVATVFFLLLSVLDKQTNAIIELTDKLERPDCCNCFYILTSYCDVS